MNAVYFPFQLGFSNTFMMIHYTRKFVENDAKFRSSLRLVQKFTQLSSKSVQELPHNDNLILLGDFICISTVSSLNNGC